jgi:hypothetical protein
MAALIAQLTGKDSSTINDGSRPERSAVVVALTGRINKIVNSLLGGVYQKWSMLKLVKFI